MENQENPNNKKMGFNKTPEENSNIDEHSHATNEDLEGNITYRQRLRTVIIWFFIEFNSVSEEIDSINNWMDSLENNVDSIKVA